MKLRITIDSRTYDVEALEDDGRLESEPSAPALSSVQSSVLPSARIGVSSADESKVYRSPLAGVVTRLDVTQGQRVQSKETLLLLEAMKMEIKIQAQSEGTVKSIEVALGAAVRPDQVLVVFE